MSDLRTRAFTVTICFAIFPAFTAAFAAESRASEDSELLLERIRARIAEHIAQLRNYTCHVAIDRLVRSAGFTSFDQRDRVELEVAFVGGRELFSRPGEARFGAEPINQIVPLGMIGNDAFGSHDYDVFSRDAAIFKYAGSCNKDGHKTFRYKFSVRQSDSLLLVKQADTAGAMVGYHGSFWVDAETLDLVRLEWKTDHIPLSVGISSVEKSMRYKVSRIGDSDFLLPARADLASFDQAGNYRLNMISLDRCLEFKGQSAITYGPPAVGASAPDAERQQR